MKYVIQPSDSISSISKKFRVEEEIILKGNSDITDPNVLIVGDTINIPIEQDNIEVLERQVITNSCPTLRFGSRGPVVTRLQRLLLTNGFNPGPIDGIFGSRTDAAVRAFQTARGLVVDGIVGVQTWTALGVNCGITPPPPGPGKCPTLRMGSRGPNVTKLQQLLLTNGFNPGPIDGIFGSRTDAAVRAFQAARGLVVDGIVGVQTWTALGVNCQGTLQSSALINQAPMMMPIYNQETDMDMDMMDMMDCHCQEYDYQMMEGPSPEYDYFMMHDLHSEENYMMSDHYPKKMKSEHYPKHKKSEYYSESDSDMSKSYKSKKYSSRQVNPCPTLRMGSRGPDVTRLQQLLLTNGFNPGPIDGIFGSRTDAAVRAFQTARGLVVDGIVGVQTWTALGVNCGITPPPPGPGPCPTLRIGSRGPDVVRLQQLLLTNGFNPGPIDGIFGSRTDAAVRAFQTSRGLVVDGIVGVQTWTALGVNCGITPPPAIECPLLRRGSRGIQVANLQSLLTRAGFPLVIDGIFGPNTQGAVISFQRSVNLPLTGIVDTATWEALGVNCLNIPPMECPVLRRGSRGSAVVMLQELLNDVGFGPLAVTGYFGPRTQASVMALQRFAGLRVTGIVDVFTWNALGVQCTM